MEGWLFHVKISITDSPSLLTPFPVACQRKTKTHFYVYLFPCCHICDEFFIFLFINIVLGVYICVCVCHMSTLGVAGTLDKLAGSHTRLAIYPTFTIHY